MTPEEINRRHEEQIRILDAGTPRKGLVDRLAVAEAELEALAQRTKEAFRAYRALDDQQTAKGAEIRELRFQIREEAARPVQMYPPTHRFAGSSSKRQGVGDPGHCEDCAEFGHVAAHPSLGCGDVGCGEDHGPDEPADIAGIRALAARKAERRKVG